MSLNFYTCIATTANFLENTMRRNFSKHRNESCVSVRLSSKILQKNVVNSSYVLLFVCYCNVMLHVSHLKPVYIILQHSRPTFSKLSQADFHCTGCNKNDFYMFLVICLCVRMCFCFCFVFVCVNTLKYQYKLS